MTSIPSISKWNDPINIIDPDTRWQIVTSGYKQQKKAWKESSTFYEKLLPPSSRKDLLLGTHVTAVDLIHGFFLKE